MPKHKTIGIQTKPEVDLDKLDEAEKAEKEKLDKTVKDLEEGDEEEEGDEDEEEKKKPPEKKPEIDYETKFKESQKEALVLKSQLDKIEAEKVKKVVVDEAFLKAKYPDWEEMTTGEQKAIQKGEELAQEVQEIRNAANQFNNDRQWQEKVTAFVTDELPDLFPDIVGREEEFTRFATRPSRKGLSFDDLGKIYLHDNPPPPKKRNLFHSTSSAGDNPTPEGGSDADNIKTLRETRPTEFMKLVRAGKIKIKI
jgi:hypothetical protein